MQGCPVPYAMAAYSDAQTEQLHLHTHPEIR